MGSYFRLSGEGRNPGEMTGRDQEAKERVTVIPHGWFLDTHVSGWPAVSFP